MFLRFCRLILSAIFLSLPAVSYGQTTPSLPGALTKPPAWLKPKDVPFDLAAFFALPPAAQNAAPLYLDALMEFSSDVAICFPDDAVTTSRKQAAEARFQRFVALNQALQKDEKSVPDSAIDTLIAEYETGFKKLSEAQERPRCVFADGISMDAPIPHAQAARHVVRIVVLRARRSLAKGDATRPLRDIQVVLRLCRDLQPHGPMICQILGAAMTQFVYKQVVVPLLSSPSLKPEHCDRLIALIAEHEAAMIDPYREGLKADYLMQRSAFRDGAGRPDDPDRDAGRRAREAMATELATELSKGADLAERQEATSGVPSAVIPELAGIEEQPTNTKLATNLAESLAKMTLAQYSGAIVAINKLYRDREAAGKLGVRERTARLDAILAALPPGDLDAGIPSRFLILIQANLPPFVLAMGRNTATLHATQCLAAVRRWNLTKHGNPPDLTTAFKAAGFPRVPGDPFDGRPMKMTILNGRPIIYSVGKDGKDDGGRLDSEADQKPGDLIYSLPQHTEL